MGSWRVIACSAAVANANTWYKTITPDENHMLCVDAPGGGAFNGNMLWLWECNGMDSQIWVFDNYQMRYGLDESFCVDAREMQNGEQLMLWECNGLPQQTWGYDGDARKVYISNTATCLDWYEGDNDNGQSLHVWDCSGASNQQWGLWDSPDPSGGGPSPPAPSPGGGDFFNSCNDQNGGSLPTFNDQNDLQNDGQWSTYFTEVYGGVPTFGYPICISGFRMLHLSALKSAGLTGVGGYSEGDEFKGMRVGYIKHNDCVGQCFSSNQWVEGLHCGTQKEQHSAWYYFGTGSGVWIWSGNTQAWPKRQDFQKDMGLSTSDCKHDFECGGKLFRVAHDDHGLDTVQYISEDKSQGGGNPMFIHTTGVGQNTCGASSTPWKAGWAAQSDCNCDQSRTCQNCQGFSSPGCSQVAVV